MKLGKHFVLLALAPLLAAPLLFWSVASTYAEGEPIRLTSSSATSEFPEGIRFKAEVEGEAEISSVAVRLRVGQQTGEAYEYLDFDARYIPPGTIITYNFEIEDVDGNRLDTDPRELIYHDARFERKEVSEGAVTVAYHGPVKTRAEIVRDAIIQTLNIVGPTLGLDITVPIRVTMYNNVKEMLEALPPGSTTIRRELITEGQAFVRDGTLLVLGSGSLAEGTASHEVTHILVHRAGDSVFRTVPAWLNEGLAEYGNIQPGFSYPIALEFAIETGRLMPITTMTILPGTPEDVIIFYGEARSIVRFMVGRFGPQKMADLMAALKSGKSIDDALEDVYGLDRLELENQWRELLGAPSYEPPEVGSALPTSIPIPQLLPYSLTPQPQSATIESTAATPTPTPEPAATPTPEPPELAADGQETQEGGGACGAPRHGGPRAIDISAVALLLGLVGLGVRWRFKL